MPSGEDAAPPQHLLGDGHHHRHLQGQQRQDLAVDARGRGISPRVKGVEDGHQQVGHTPPTACSRRRRAAIRPGGTARRAAKDAAQSRCPGREDIAHVMASRQALLLDVRDTVDLIDQLRDDLDGRLMPNGGGAFWMMTGSAAARRSPRSRRRHRPSPAAARRAAAPSPRRRPAPARARANVMAALTLVAATLATTGTRCRLWSMTTSTTKRRSSSVRTMNSLASAGTTRPWTPAEAEIDLPP